MKKIVINLWKILQHFLVITNFKKFLKSKEIRIFYAGALSGDNGGPYVKINRIKTFFPKHYFNFNLVYILSNALFLMPNSIKFLKKLKITLILNQNGVFYPGWFK